MNRILQAEQMVNTNKQLVKFIKENNIKICNFACSRSGEGVSTLLVELARFIMNESSARILLIDANWKHPSLHNLLKTPQEPGLSDLLSAGKTHIDYIHKTRDEFIDITPCGHMPEDLKEKKHAKFLDFLSKNKTKYDYIFIDSSPVLESMDSLFLASSADTTILIVQAYNTRWEVVQKAQSLLKNSGCEIGYVVLNRVKEVIPNWIYKKL